MGRQSMYENVDEATRQEIINIKHLITTAGRIQDKIADDVASLEALKKEIKLYEQGMATTPETEVVLVSGEFVAALTGEAAQREKGPDVNRTVFGLLGIDKFLEICNLPVLATKKALGVDQYDAVCPASYNGTGRRFSLKKKT
jgi:hypothetical protein